MPKKMSEVVKNQIILCELCKKELKNLMSLSAHIQQNHKEYNSQKYFDSFFKKESEGKCEFCGESTSWVNLRLGYKKLCSKKECVAKNITGKRNYWSKHIRPYTPKLKYLNLINEICFDRITEPAAYFLGLLEADGHIWKLKPHHQGSVEFGSVDEELVQMWNNFISGGQWKVQVIQKYKDGKEFGKIQYRVAFANEKIYQRLQELGLHERKTYRNDFKLSPEIQKDNFWHYLRGLFDGDGWFSCDYFGLCGTEALCKEIKLELEKNNIRCLPLRKQGNIFKLFVWKQDNQKLYGSLYKGATVFLYRKRKKFEESLIKQEQ